MYASNRSPRKDAQLGRATVLALVCGMFSSPFNGLFGALTTLQIPTGMAAHV